MAKVPSFLETIRFRLSLAFALVVFAVGSLAIVGVFIQQNSELDEPVIMTERQYTIDENGDRVLKEVIPEKELERVEMEQLELDAYRRALDQLRNASFAALGALFLGSFVAGWFLSGWALKPLRTMTSVAQGITGSDLGKRIGMKGPHDEIRDMGDTFDSMLDRLEVAFDDQRRFVAEASHELRNPLAVARTNLELALYSGDEEEIREAAKIAHDATQRMSGMVDELLGQARESLPIVAKDELDMAELADSVAAENRAAARQRGIRLDVETESITVKGDALALRRAANNLLANAIRLAPEGSTISITVKPQNGKASLSVTDEGPGLTAEERIVVFDRFWQGSGQEGRGAGLGLAIVKRIAERHGGQAEVYQAGSGSRFVITV